MSGHSDQSEPLVQRARNVAAGLADTGLTHAEEMLRRMSPEGREQARRERRAKARRQRRLLASLAVAAILSLLAFAVWTIFLDPIAALAAAAAMLLSLILVVVWHADPRASGREALAGAALPDLAEEAAVWLAAQHRGLPMPALQLASALGHRLDDLAPRLGTLDPRSSTAAAIRKVISVVPDLVESWRSIPVSLRGRPQADGCTANDHLVNGLHLIEGELGRVSEEIGYGTRAKIAVQGRYLELKYSDDARLS